MILPRPRALHGSDVAPHSLVELGEHLRPRLIMLLPGLVVRKATVNQTDGSSAAARLKFNGDYGLRPFGSGSDVSSTSRLRSSLRNRP
jgi:hypothetical protein